MARKPKHRRQPGRIQDLVEQVVGESGRPNELREACVRFGNEFLVTLRRRPGPDFEEQTKRVVVKRFERGFSGRLLWRIGSSLLAALFGR